MNEKEIEASKPRATQSTGSIRQDGQGESSKKEGGEAVSEESNSTQSSREIIAQAIRSSSDTGEAIKAACEARSRRLQSILNPHR